MPASRGRIGLIALAAAAVVGLAAGVWLSGRPTSGQSSQAFQAPRLKGTDKPDLTGIWQSFTTANWDIQDHSAETGPFPRVVGIWGAQTPGQSIVEGNELPYRPEALARKQENFKNRLKVDHDNINTVGDPEAKCYLPGVPRATYMPYPFQILQSTDKIVIAYQYANAARTIPLDKAPEPPVDFWMGWSNGHWEGDTLVVDVKGFNEMTWFDRAGNYHSEALHVVERYTPVSAYHLNYEATIEDPKVFTRPWKISLPLYRRMEKNLQLLEFKCVDLAEEYVYGGLIKPPTPTQ
jgi:hypothetical protein